MSARVPNSLLEPEELLKISNFRRDVADHLDDALREFDANFGILSVKDFGAVGDGATDDTAAIQAAFDAIGEDGGSLYFPPGVYRVVTKITFDKSNLIIYGSNAEILFDPDLPIAYPTNDGCFLIHCGDDVPADQSALFDIVGAIDVGDTSFTVDNAGAAADMAADLWLHIQETDVGAIGPDEIVFIDWVQVASVAGATVNVNAPFRTAFPGTHSTVKYRRINRVVRNVTVRDLRFRFEGADTVALLTIGIAREVTLENVTITSTTGNGLATYRAADVVMNNVHVFAGSEQACEIASTVDIKARGCTFAALDGTPVDCALLLSFGTAFFDISGNHIGPSAQIGCQILNGCHDGAFIGNTIDWVRDAGITNTLGLLVQGCRRNVIAYNTLVGGDGATGQGIVVADSTVGMAAALLTGDNFILHNNVQNFALPYGTKDPDDVYVTVSGAATTFSGPITISDPIGTTFDGAMAGGLISEDTTAQAANVGGSISFSGKYTNAGDITVGAAIKAAKTNGTTGNFSFDLALGSRPNGSNVTERVRIKDDGTVWFVSGQVLGSGVAYGTTGASESGFIQLYNPGTGKMRIDAAPSFGLDINENGAQCNVIGKLKAAAELEIDGALNHDGSTVGFYGTAPVAQQTGVAVTAIAIHAALVNLGLITA